jgi:hypothetical protein
MTTAELGDLFAALGYAAVYALAAGLLLVVAYYVLDLITPGHLGTHLRGVDSDGNESVHAQSKGAAVVTSAWLLSNSLVLFTAIWRNGDADLGVALAATIAFGAFGILLNTVMFFVIEAITPGDLRAIVTQPGPVRPLAWVAAAIAFSVAGIVCASIA